MTNVSRLGPHSIEAEEAVIGSVLINPEALEVSSFLQPADFFELKHSWLWETLQAMHQRSEAIDNLTLVDALRNRGKLEEVGGPAYVTHLVNSTPTHLYAETYGRIVERAAIRRRLMAAAGDIAQIACNENAEIDDVIAECNQRLTQAGDRQGHQEPKRIGEAARDYYTLVERAAQEGNPIGVPTGIPELDKIFDWYDFGNLNLIAARPAVGKSAVMLNMARNMAMAGVPVLFVSLEMSTDQLTNRLLAMQAQVNSAKLRTGKLESHEWDALTNATAVLDTWPIYLEYDGAIRPTALNALIARYKRLCGVQVVFVDYLQLMQADHDEDSREREIASITRALKRAAGQNNVVVIAGAQLSRKVEERADKRPMLADLRESGSQEQDADTVVFLYRDEMYNPNTETPNVIELNLSKNRQGPTGLATSYFRKEHQLLVEPFTSNIDLSSYSPVVVGR